MLFHVYGENALPQWIAMLGVLAALILLNEVARRTKAGGILMFFVIPAILTVYFIAIAVGAKTGASWALNNQTYLYMNRKNSLVQSVSVCNRCHQYSDRRCK